MAATSTDELKVETVSNYDRKIELKAFDDSKTGVQGLIENGITKVPPMFYCGHSELSDGLTTDSNSNFSVPIIDLTHIQGGPILRDEIVRKVRYASEKWGFFQVVNHGIPTHVLDEMIKGTCMFHQQDPKVRKEYYTRDLTRKVIYLSNVSLYQDPFLDWRDTLACFLTHHLPKAEELPAVCSNVVIEYSKKVMELASDLFELLSEALGLNRFHLNEMGCDEGMILLCHYYPPCPEPELTMGSRKHADACFMTMLLQDQIGGLQVLHDNQWIDVPPVYGALVVNIGDLLQFVSNDKFISVQHRVLAKNIGPRISIASFFRSHDHSPDGMSKVIGPIKELLSEENPPIYRETSLKEYLAHRMANGVGASSLLPFKL